MTWLLGQGSAVGSEPFNADMTGVFTGAGASGVFRHAGLEAALSANWSPEAVAGVEIDSSELMSDLHCTAEYRANLIRVMAKRAVKAS